MGTTIMLLCVAGQLMFWDIRLKILQTVSRGAARRHLDRRVSGMAHRLLLLARTYGGLTVELDRRLVRDLPNPALLCSNHQSVADIVVLLDALAGHRLRFVAKKELAHGFPAVSEVLRIQQHALIDRRGDFKRGARELRRLGRETANGTSPVVFPEGTRSRDGRVQTFHPGGVRTILTDATVPIVAVAVDGGQYFVSVKDLFGGLSRIVYRARLVGIFQHDGSKESVRTALRNAHDAIAAQIEHWRAKEIPERGI